MNFDWVNHYTQTYTLNIKSLIHSFIVKAPLFNKLVRSILNQKKKKLRDEPSMNILE